MIIVLKNKHTLQIDDFFLNCSIEKGLTMNKKEGDKKIKGIFEIENLIIEKINNKPETSLNLLKLKIIWDGVMMLIFQQNITNL